MTKATTTRTTEQRRLSRSPSSLLLALLTWACAAAHAPPRAAPPAPTAALHHGPLTDFVSAAGLRWLVLAKPKEILADPELSQAIAAVVPERRFEAFTEASGVDLSRVGQAAVAGFPYATLYLAELPAGVAGVARERFSERLLTGATRKQPRPTLLRITGVVGQTPETLLTMDDHVLAVAVGDPLLAKIAEAYAEERLKSSPTALHGSALSSLPDLTSNAALLLAPGPFADEWRSAAGGLLGSAVALEVAAQPTAHGTINATLCISGAWGASADEAARRLARAWAAFADSSAGRLFELSAQADVTSNPDLLTLRVVLNIAPLVRGLRAAVLNDISEIIRLPSNSRERAPADAPAPAAE